MELSFNVNPQFKTLISPQPSLPRFSLHHLNPISKPPIEATTLITAARKSPRRPTLRISTKAALECALLIASGLKIIPEPIGLMLKDGISGGGGGGGGDGVWKCLGGDGFDGWRRRRRRKRWGTWRLVMVIAIGVLMFGGYPEMGVLVMVVGMLEGYWKRGGKGWIFGFCCCVLMVVLGVKREDLQTSKIGSAVMDLFKKKRRRRRLI